MLVRDLSWIDLRPTMELIQILRAAADATHEAGRQGSTASDMQAGRAGAEAWVY